MKLFAQLFQALDATTSTLRKLQALQNYLAQASAGDAAWAIYFLAGGKPRQLIPTRLIRSIAQRITQFPEWLIDESYDAVGDLAETIAHLLPDPADPDATPDLSLQTWIEQRLEPLRKQTPEHIQEALTAYFAELDWSGRFLFIKLIGGGFRVGVSRLLVLRALAQHCGVDSKILAQRMVGYTDARRRPCAEDYLHLISAQPHDQTLSGHPYPFFLAHALQQDIDTLGDTLGACADWLVEWKWDGIRSQLVKRAGQIWIWSRGEELISERFPELQQAALAALDALPDGTVLDGEILIWDNARHRPRPFADLQKRITRKSVSKKMLTDLPATFLAYDVLEWQGTDQRGQPQHTRRALLESICALIFARLGDLVNISGRPLQISPLVSAESWAAFATLRSQSRQRGVEGLMLKHRDAAYGAGRTKEGGVWWKWKIDPFTIDAVLIYAQAGHGRRASLYTDYTFAVWSESIENAATRTLVPFAKAYSGLTDAEMHKVDALIRKTTTEKFGPVRSVTPTMVFELGFEGIQASPRHKSGIAVRFPRILRWRTDKTVAEADTLPQLRALLTFAEDEQAK